jgi:exopolysaccharide biosynthesis polyprenyl glycosylphosphotransferase
MVTARTHGIHGLFLWAQLAGVSVLYWFWLWMTHFGHSLGDLPIASYTTYHAVLLLGVVLGFITEQSRDYFSNPNFRSSTNNALWQLIFSAGCLFVYLVMTQDRQASRLFLFTFMALEYAFLTLSQRYLPSWLIRMTFSGGYEQRVALVGPSRKAAALKNWLKAKRSIGYNTIGLLTDDTPGDLYPDLKSLGCFAELEAAILKWEITQVILVELPESSETLRHCTLTCEKHGVRLLVLCDFEERFRHAVTFFEDGSLRFVGLRKEPLENPINRFFKRILDLMVALPVTLVILPPVSLAVWILHRFQSPGPLFFVQQRSGLQNQTFQMFKYRTMHPVNDDEARQATRDDPRLFPAGNWLRRFSLDELPQFLNVILGDMSVVGPRPHLPKHNQLFARALGNYHVRAVIKPGITGLAQVRGFRGGTYCDQDIADRVGSDIHYLENWTFLLDCAIVLRTVVHMVRPPKSAY